MNSNWLYKKVVFVGFGICVLLMTLFFQFPDTTQYLLAGGTPWLALWHVSKSDQVNCLVVHLNVRSSHLREDDNSRTLDFRIWCMIKVWLAYDSVLKCNYWPFLCVLSIYVLWNTIGRILHTNIQILSYANIWFKHKTSLGFRCIFLSGP